MIEDSCFRGEGLPFTEYTYANADTMKKLFRFNEHEMLPI